MSILFNDNPDWDPRKIATLAAGAIIVIITFILSNIN